MGIKKKHIDIQQAEINYELFLDELCSIVKPYLHSNGKLDSIDDLTEKTSTLLASILDCRISIENTEQSKFFCADDILAKQVIIENGEIIKFWGIIYWLETPIDYEINKTGKDPFYAEFRISNNKLSIQKMMCGDYDKTNIDKAWWFDLELNWIYVFKNGTKVL